MKNKRMLAESEPVKPIGLISLRKRGSQTPNRRADSGMKDDGAYKSHQPTTESKMSGDVTSKS